MLCHIYFVRTDVLRSGLKPVVPSGGCFVASLDLGKCFAAVVLLHFSRYFTVGDLAATTKAVQL